MITDEKIVNIKIPKRILEYALEELSLYTDERGPGDCPYPASDKWCSFYAALEDAIDQDSGN